MKKSFLKNHIIFKKQKALTGLLFGILAFAICALFFSLKAGVMFACAFMIIGCFELNTSNQLKFVNILWCLFSLLSVCFISQFILEMEPIWTLNTKNIFLEFICVTILFLLMHIVFFNVRISFFISSLIVVILSLTNYYIIAFRGNEFTPADFASIRTALNVSGGYNYTISAMVGYGILLWLLVVFSSFSLTLKTPQKTSSSQHRIFYVLFECLLMFIWYIGCSNAEIYTWGIEGSKFNGYLVNFSAQLLELTNDKKPANYSINKIKELENQYASQKSSLISEEAPTIIAIMNESFSDLSILGKELNTSIPVTPFYDSLNANTIKGNALVSTYGGGTANSEYEFLTGNTMGFVSKGATVYQLYLKNKSYSLASKLKEYGYYCIATHPYYSNGWSRSNAWNYLGFDKTTFIEDYPQKNLIRDYVSDQEMYEYIIQQYQEKETNKPLFLFGITMQNHSGYDYSGNGITPNIDLNGYSTEYPDAEQYLGLLHESDKALRYLINHFDNVDEKVLILFYGDHLPKINSNFFEEVHGDSFDTLDAQQLQYMIPFFIWTNYDIEEEEIELTSLNFLSNYLYEAAGLSLPPYNQFLEDVSTQIPAMNSLGYYSKSQNCFLEYEQALDDEATLLNDYEILQYNCMFDHNAKSDLFFSN